MSPGLEKLLDEILELDAGLSGSEMDFLDNLDQNYRDRDLTDRQVVWIEQIAHRMELL